MSGVGILTGVTFVNATKLQVTVDYQFQDDGVSRFTVTTNGVESHIVSVSIFAGD